MEIITSSQRTSRTGLRRWYSIGMTCLGIVIFAYLVWQDGSTIAIGPWQVNAMGLKVIGFIILGFIFRLAFRDRPMPFQTSRSEFKIPLGTISGVDPTELSHRMELKIKELLEKYHTTDLNDSRVQGELKDYIQTLSTKVE